MERVVGSGLPRTRYRIRLRLSRNRARFPVATGAAKPVRRSRRIARCLAPRVSMARGVVRMWSGVQAARLRRGGFRALVRGGLAAFFTQGPQGLRRYLAPGRAQSGP